MLFPIVLLSLVCFAETNLNASIGNASRFSEIKQARSQDVPTIPFCELVDHPDVYSGKLVRIRVTYISTWESNTLYDSRCNDVKHYVSPQLKCDDNELCASKANKLTRNLSGNQYYGMRVQLVMVGKLNAPTAGNQQSHSKERLTFEIHEIEEAHRIPARTPLPWKTRR